MKATLLILIVVKEIINNNSKKMVQTETLNFISFFFQERKCKKKKKQRRKTGNPETDLLALSQKNIRDDSYDCLPLPFISSLLFVLFRRCFTGFSFRPLSFYVEWQILLFSSLFMPFQDLLEIQFFSVLELKYSGCLKDLFLFAYIFY